MSADDLAAVRDALDTNEVPILRKHNAAALAALDRLAARLQEAERIKTELNAYGWKQAAHAEAAEARAKALREALELVRDVVEGWDTKPPRSRSYEERNGIVQRVAGDALDADAV